MTTEATPLPRRLGRYELCQLLATGGMGQVYLARLAGPAGLQRWVAVKILRPELAEDPRFVRMFLDELRILSHLAHPNLCAVVDFGVADGRHFLAMEYLRCETLAALGKKLHQEAEKLSFRPWDIVARVVADAARGLHAAHMARGADGALLSIVHRDVAPQNIAVLYEGATKVMDFGIATLRGKESTTRTGEIKGRFAYMSPEQLRGIPLDGRSDVFSLGVVAWEACTGHRLFRGSSEGDTVLNVMTLHVPKPSALLGGFPEPLERALLCALRREPGDRTPSAAALADELEEYLATLGRPLGAAQVAQLMDRLFPARAELTAEPSPEGAFEPSGATRSKASTATTRHRSPWSPSGFRYWRLIALLSMPVAAAGMAWAVLGAMRSPPPKAPSPRASVRALTADSPARVTNPEIPAPAPASPAIAVPVSPVVGETAKGTALHRRSQFGELNVLTRPTYAEVFLHGRRLGTTPLYRTKLAAGRHTLELRPVGGGASRTVAVEVRPGKLTSVSVRLDR